MSSATCKLKVGSTESTLDVNTVFKCLRSGETAALIAELVNKTIPSAGAVSESTLKNTQKSKDPTTQVSFLDWLLSGNMKDRHLFSMICYENFASMHHLPYILSVFNLQAFTPEGGFKDGVYEPEIDKQYPLTESLLYHWCHGKNFNNTFLVWNYALKHIFTAVSAFIMLAVMVWSAIILHDDMAASETFR